MCLEDLRLGRGRRFGQTVFTAVNTSSILPANANRVAVVISVFRGGITTPAGGPNQYDMVWVNWGPSMLANPDLAIPVGSGPVLLRVEDYGQLVTGTMSVTLLDFSALGITAIFTTVTHEDNATPL